MTDRPGEHGASASDATPQTRAVTPATPREARRAYFIRWGVVFGLIIAAFIATVVIVNSTVLSARGFADTYLSALARHNVAGALDLPGVTLPDDGNNAMLDPNALGRVSNIQLAADRPVGAGAHRLEYELDLNGTAARTTLSVEPAGRILGLFNSWRFAASPVGLIDVTPASDSRFLVNGLSITAPDGPGSTVRMRVLVPGVVRLSQDTNLIEAKPADILVLDRATVSSVVVAASAKPGFVRLVQEQLNGLLDDCVTQQVLKPTGCPFGETVRDRITGPPEWSMVEYPSVAIQPGSTPGTWEVPPSDGAVRLNVDVRSLFDGTVSRLDEVVPFTVGYLISFADDGSPVIRAR